MIVHKCQLSIVQRKAKQPASRHASYMQASLTYVFSQNYQNASDIYLNNEVLLKASKKVKRKSTGHPC